MVGNRERIHTELRNFVKVLVLTSSFSKNETHDKDRCISKT